MRVLIKIMKCRWIIYEVHLSLKVYSLWSVAMPHWILDPEAARLHIKGTVG